MKLSRMTAILFVLVAGTGVAFAGSGGGGDGKGGKGGDRHAARAAHRAEMLAKYDANSDGKLDDAERTKLREARADELFDKLDSNRDGSISRAELKAGHSMMKRGGHRGHGKHMKASRGDKAAD